MKHKHAEHKMHEGNKKHAKPRLKIKLEIKKVKGAAHKDAAKMMHHHISEMHKGHKHAEHHAKKAHKLAGHMHKPHAKKSMGHKGAKLSHI